MLHPLVSMVSMTSLLLASAAAFAQARKPGDPQAASVAARADKTIIEFELIGRGALSGGIKAHRWAETLDKLGVSVRVRQPTVDDEPGVTEKTRGTLRWVTVIGLLDNKGHMLLPDRKFSASDIVLLREWIDELKLYGAQGAPEGKPLWGLSKTQFDAIFAALGKPISQASEGQTLTKALQQMNLPPEYPVRFHSTAAQQLSAAESSLPVRQRLAGISCGTGLAALLADYGLGFRPLRTPAGAIELAVQPLADISNAWPVGWEPPPETLRRLLAPQLFKMVPVQFDEVPLQDVLDAITQASGVPIIIDHRAVEQKGIDLAETTLSYPAKRVAWIQVIHSAATRNRMTQKLRVDELGQPFVHVAPFVPRRLEN